jgi:sarcosine oxidase subunit alpha
MSGFRIDGRRDTRIDWDRAVAFDYDGRARAGYVGDTLASALLAGGARDLARSFKYGRPRGLVGVGPEEPNVLVGVGEDAQATPDLKATEVELYAGLIARAARGPITGIDAKSIAGRLARFMPAGFYYKTFMAPQSLWPRYERWIRAAAGFGTVPVAPDVDRYDVVQHHVDVLVIGGGAAGLAAALCAARAGRRTLLVDEQSEPGGHLLTVPTFALSNDNASNWRGRLLAELRAAPHAQVLERTTAFALHTGNLVQALERVQDHLPLTARDAALPRQRLHRIRAAQVVLATGALARPLVFEGNDVPGVMTAAAMHTYLNRYAVGAGRRVLIATGDDSAYAVACDLATAGIATTLADARDDAAPAWRERAQRAGVEILAAHGIAQVHGTREVRGATLVRLADGGRRIASAGPRWEGDAIGSVAALAPTVHLACHDGSRPTWDERMRAFVVPQDARSGVTCVGAITGAATVAAALAQTTRAMTALLGTAAHGDLAARTDEPAPSPAAPVFRTPDDGRPGAGRKAFIDLQNDVTVADIGIALRENYASAELLKRYTGLSFGTDQGKLSGINGIGIAAEILGRPIDDLGTTTYRPAYTPVTFAALAAARPRDLYDPVRATPMHAWHDAHGAVHEPVGQWLRPRAFPAAGESLDAAVARECRAVRTGVGMMDASTLGKIDIRGADARTFLDRVYANAWSKLAPGRCRYGLMLDESGMVMDDGVTACIADDHFLMTTTTGGAARVLRWLELWLQTEWPDLDVWLTSVTDHWATCTLAGAASRDVLAKVCTDIDLARDAFPFMTWRPGHVAGVPARVFRISFSGELAYEVNIDAGYGEHVWCALMDAGRLHGITPYGTDAMHVLRAEKGYVIVGQDTDGSVTPGDLGMDWAVAMGKPYSFIGKRSLARSDTARTDRRHLVGLLTQSPQRVIGEGAQIVASPPAGARPATMLGHVTSSYMSATLGHSIALAMIDNGRTRHGETLYACHRGSVEAVRVVAPIFYDAEGARHRD